MVNGCPEECSMTRERHLQASQTSRMQVEMDMIETWCPALKPRFFAAPDGGDDRINGMEYQVELTEGTLFGKSQIRLEMVIPDTYPAEIPRIYIPGLTLKDWDSKAHMYRDSEQEIHMCIFFPEKWTIDHTLACMMIRSTIWLNKYVTYRSTGTWPGKGQAHCGRCGKRECEC